MIRMKKSASIDELQTIPGVGKEISNDLVQIGIRKVSDLKGKDPESLYEKLCEAQGAKIDRCMLYVLRCAVYYAETLGERRDPELLKWWKWKD